MTCRCTCGWVELPELPQLPICSPSSTSWPAEARTEPLCRCARATKAPLSRSRIVTEFPATAATPFRRRAAWPSA